MSPGDSFQLFRFQLIGKGDVAATVGDVAAEVVSNYSDFN